KRCPRLMGPRLGRAAAEQGVVAVTNLKAPTVKGVLDQLMTPALKELAEQQVRFAPPAKRLEQLARAGQLLAEIDPERPYPYQFVCSRITGYRPDAYPDLLVPGDVLKHDLGFLIEAMGGAVPVEAIAEPVLTLEQISRRLNVSTKTISRWKG